MSNMKRLERLRNISEEIFAEDIDDNASFRTAFRICPFITWLVVGVIVGTAFSFTTYTGSDYSHFISPSVKAMCYPWYFIFCLHSDRFCVWQRNNVCRRGIVSAFPGGFVSIARLCRNT